MIMAMTMAVTTSKGLMNKTTTLHIYHLHISHNASYLPPKILHNILFHFSWVLQLSEEKLKTTLVQNFGGQIRCIMGDVRVVYALHFLVNSLLSSTGLLCEIS